MKTKLTIEIETKDTYGVWEDADKTAEDYTKAELEKYDKQYTKDIHKAVVQHIKNLTGEDLEEGLLDGSMEELVIEGWETLEDYGIKIKVTEQQ